MKAIKTIFLVWRKGKGSRRKKIGIIKKNASEAVRFKYIEEGVREAQEEGFTCYPDFPNFSKVYTENVLEIFTKRLIRQERSDAQKYLDFWDIDSDFVDDKFYVLAYTQGLLSTDNFEFLADFHPIKELKFVTELSGLSYLDLSSDSIKLGDVLNWKLDRGNKYDDHAVKVFNKEKHVGYVKMVHSKVFYSKLKTPLKIRVKGIDQNGKINRVFIEVSF